MDPRHEISKLIDAQIDAVFVNRPAAWAVAEIARLTALKEWLEQVPDNRQRLAESRRRQCRLLMQQYEAEHGKQPPTKWLAAQMGVAYRSAANYRQGAWRGQGSAVQQQPKQ